MVINIEFAIGTHTNDGSFRVPGMSVDKVANMYVFKGMSESERARFPALPNL